MQEHGLDTVKPPISGDETKMPAIIRRAIDTAK
jgi:hypothetical protein